MTVEIKKMSNGVNVMIMTDETGTLFVAEGRYSPWPQKMIYPPDPEFQKDLKDEELVSHLDRMGYSL